MGFRLRQNVLVADFQVAHDKKYGNCEIMCFRKQNSLEGRITSRIRSATECSMFAVF